VSDASTRHPNAEAATPEGRRRTLPGRAAFLLAAGVIGLSLMASVTPSPLYHTYAELWDFSPLTLTLVYATYAFGVLTTLLLAGRVSDEVGRRPVLLVSLVTLMASTVLFMLAGSVAWLFVARGLQGLATGAALSAASAALLDFHPRRDPTGVALTNTVASAGGLGVGLLSSALLVEYGSAPRVLPYVVLFALFAVAFVGAYLMPEPVRERGRLHLTWERPTVPAVARRPFVLAGLAVLSSWSIGGLFFSLGPQLGAQLFETTNVLVSSIGIIALAASATVATLLGGRAAPWKGASGGSLALAAGTLLIVVSADTETAWAYLAGSIVAGVGFGIAFLGGLRALVAVIPPEHRAAVMSAFYVVAYGSLSVPAVLAGLVVRDWGLETTFEVFGIAVIGIALLVAAEAWRTRPVAAGAPAMVSAGSR
jgi:MFS family permease